MACPEHCAEGEERMARQVELGICSPRELLGERPIVRPADIMGIFGEDEAQIGLVLELADDLPENAVVASDQRIDEEIEPARADVAADIEAALAVEMADDVITAQRFAKVNQERADIASPVLDEGCLDAPQFVIAERKFDGLHGLGVCDRR